MSDSVDDKLLQQLGKAMSDVSEDCYYAGWMDNTADMVPELCRRAIESGLPQHWGFGQITPAKARQLTELAEQAGAWADLHHQDDYYVPYHPFPVSAQVSESADQEQQAGQRRGRAG